ncbi:hypothetical protein GCM10022226_28060 [Sphaerisporangium flaviroseum]|uniref:Carboxymuconolactone decarboxylase-like domain-containing protein n=1 Tax=Sphaerisporangium flaviroseum TaxID=509199 RepID=A0ABP7I4W2_9ACTN
MHSLFRHITPVPPEDATDQVAAVYEQVNEKFSTIGPAVMMLSPAPELLVPGWALLREALVAGTAPRRHKEVVTVSVSQANQCAYDVAGHSSSLSWRAGETRPRRCTVATTRTTRRSRPSRGGPAPPPTPKPRT